MANETVTVKALTVNELLDALRSIHPAEVGIGVHMQIADELEKVLAPLQEFGGYETGNLLGVIANDCEQPSVGLSPKIRGARATWMRDLVRVIEKRLAPKLSSEGD